MDDTVTSGIHHCRLAILNIKHKAGDPWPNGFAWLLVTGVPAGVTCEGLKGGPYGYIEDQGEAGTYSSADFQVTWDLLITGGWAVKRFRPSCDPAIPARDRLQRSRVAYYVPTHPDSGLYLVRGARRLARRYEGQFVDHGMLAPDLRELLARAQDAADTLSTSSVAAAGRIEDPAPEAARDEWEIACALRDLTSVRRRHAPAATAGQENLSWAREVIGSVTARIEALERYAAQVAAADAAHARQERAMAAAAEETPNDVAPVLPEPSRPEDDSEVLDLLASTASNAHSAADLDRLTQDVSSATAAIQDAIPPASPVREPDGGA